MRMSCLPNDPGFLNYIQSGAGAKIYLDGVLQDECVTADEEGGFVICNKLDSDGTPMIDYLSNTTVKITKYGHVEIVPWQNENTDTLSTLRSQLRSILRF